MHGHKSGPHGRRSFESLEMNRIFTWATGVLFAGVLGVGVYAAWNFFAPLPPAGYGDTRADEVFRDCDVCPDMLPIPTGEVSINVTTERLTRYLVRAGLYAGPQRHVTIGRAFALGRTEVTFAQWDACVADGGCDGLKPSDEGWGRGDHPVIHVSWNNAQAYVRWLSQKTGQTYRLPTEAEWEYAARAGARTLYPWGQQPDHDRASFGEDACCVGVTEGKDVWPNTSPAGSFPPNAFGLHDMNGNVYEWVQDCFDYNLPTGRFDQSTVNAEDCENRAMRGGAWYSDPYRITSIYRGFNPPDYHDAVIGFRVAREM